MPVHQQIAERWPDFPQGKEPMSPLTVTIAELLADQVAEAIIRQARIDAEQREDDACE